MYNGVGPGHHKNPNGFNFLCDFSIGKQITERACLHLSVCKTLNSYFGSTDEEQTTSLYNLSVDWIFKIGLEYNL